MLFNSFIFIFIFLPITVGIFLLIGRQRLNHLHILWLVIASVIFYGWWKLEDLVLMAGSLIANYFMGIILADAQGRLSLGKKKVLLISAIALNLAVLGYFKYADFIINNMNAAFHYQWPTQHLVLPLAISFYTFTQIAYLVDAYEHKAHEYDFVQYCFFVIFFPHLLAGPIVHHKEIIAQLQRKPLVSSFQRNFSIGITIFIIGLFKKIVIADQLALYVAPVFKMAALPIDNVPNFFESWIAVLAYTLQIYFDFSGYSDMAIGLSRIFNIKLPLNFYSPYKATNIIDFWRRWHITLSRFLKEYVYIPLGGNRHGGIMRYRNLVLTMILGGLWHGANWTFIVWGLLHGFYLMVNHLWRSVLKHFSIQVPTQSWVLKLGCATLTFLSVVVGWVFFRSDSLTTAFKILKGMCGFNGFVLWNTYQAPLNKLGGLGDKLVELGWKFDKNLNFTKESMVILAIALLIVWVLPNTQQIMHRYNPSLCLYKDTHKGFYWYKFLYFRPTLLWAMVITAAFLITVTCYFTQATEFLYYQF